MKKTYMRYKFKESTSRLIGSCQGLGGGGNGVGRGGELCLGNRVSVLWMKTVLEVDCGDGNMDVFNSTKLEFGLPRWR